MNAKELLTEWLDEEKVCLSNGNTVIDTGFVIRKLEQILQAMEDEKYLEFVLRHDA